MEKKEQQRPMDPSLRHRLSPETLRDLQAAIDIHVHVRTLFDSAEGLVYEALRAGRGLTLDERLYVQTCIETCATLHQQFEARVRDIYAGLPQTQR